MRNDFFKRTAYLLLCLAITGMAFFPMRAMADGTSSSGATFEALAAWANDDRTAGGTFTLTGGVTVSGSLKLRERTVDAGEYGLVVEGYLALGEGSAVVGAGEASPVIRAQNGGILAIEINRRYEMRARIEATGENATAIEIGADSGEPYFDGYLQINAAGAGSTAVRSEVPTTISYAFINAADIGVECTEPLELYLCEVNAGIISPQIFIDTCFIEGIGDDVTRKITDVAIPFYAYCETGDDMFWRAGVFDRIRVTLSAEEADFKYELFSMDVPEYAYDLDVAGVHSVACTLIMPYHWLQVDCFIGIEFEVYDPSAPFFKTIRWASGYDEADYVYTHHGVAEYAYRGSVSALTAWKCAVGDDEWTAVSLEAYDWDAQTGNLEADEEAGRLTMHFRKDELDAPFWFYFEVEDVGDSAVIFFSEDGVGGLAGLGGDHDYGDRTGGALPPPRRSESGFGANPSPPLEGEDSGGSSDDESADEPPFYAETSTNSFIIVAEPVYQARIEPTPTATPAATPAPAARSDAAAPPIASSDAPTPPPTASPDPSPSPAPSPALAYLPAEKPPGALTVAPEPPSREARFPAWLGFAALAVTGLVFLCKGRLPKR